MLLDSREFVLRFVVHQILIGKDTLNKKQLTRTSGHPLMKIADHSGGDQGSFQKPDVPDLTAPVLTPMDLKHWVKGDKVISS
jgi:hypothetical protein